MRLLARVVNQETRTGTIKNGKRAGQEYTMRNLTLMDASKRNRMSTQIQLTLGDEDDDLDPEKLLDTEILVDLTEITAGFGGMLRARGLVVRQETKANATAGNPAGAPPSASTAPTGAK